MSEAKHTPGPWKVIISSWENSLICAEDGTLIAICKINADVTEDTQDEFESIKNYNADLLADAWQLPDLRRENAELKVLNKEMYESLETVCGACIYVKLAGKKCCEYCVINKALRKARGEANNTNSEEMN